MYRGDAYKDSALTGLPVFFSVFFGCPSMRLPCIFFVFWIVISRINMRDEKLSRVDFLCFSEILHKIMSNFQTFEKFVFFLANKNLRLIQLPLKMRISINFKLEISFWFFKFHSPKKGRLNSSCFVFVFSISYRKVSDAVF